MIVDLVLEDCRVKDTINVLGSYYQITKTYDDMVRCFDIDTNEYHTFKYRYLKDVKATYVRMED